MAARLSALRTCRTLPPGFFIFKDSWYSFLLRGWVDPRAIVRPEELGQFKKIHLIGTWTRDPKFPICRKVTTFSFSRVRIVVYRVVARQRPRNKKRVQPLLCNRRINKRPILSNGSVNTFPRKRTRTQQQKNHVFDMTCIEGLSWTQLIWPV
jgi:hypothetical protein